MMTVHTTAFVISNYSTYSLSWNSTSPDLSDLCMATSDVHMYIFVVLNDYIMLPKLGHLLTVRFEVIMPA